MSKIKKIIFVGIFMGLSLFVFDSFDNSVLANDASGTWDGAWDTYTPLAPLPGTTDSTNCDTNSKGEEECATTLETYLPGIFKLAIGISGVLAVIMIVVGGIEYISTDAIQGKTEGKERIQNALWGLLLVFVSWLILYTINPDLLKMNLNIETTTTTVETDGSNGETTDGEDNSSGESGDAQNSDESGGENNDVPSVPLPDSILI